MIAPITNLNQTIKKYYKNFVQCLVLLQKRPNFRKCPHQKVELVLYWENLYFYHDKFSYFDFFRQMIILILHEHKKNRYYTRRIMGFHERPMDALSVTGKDISFQNGLYVHVWNGMSLGRSKPCLFCRSGTALNCQSGTILNCHSETILNCHSETILNCHSRTAIEAFKAFKAVQNLAFFAVLERP